MFRIVFIVALLILVVLALAATKPNTIHLQRSIVIEAPAQKIFALLDDFHNWKAWAPGDKDDPAMQRTYSGPASGLGATSDWRGSGSTGAGRMAITDSAPNSRVTVTVDFARPFVAHNVNVFTLEASSGSTAGGAAGGRQRRSPQTSRGVSMEPMFSC